MTEEVSVEATGETVGEAKWSALRELEQRAPGIDREAVRFQVVSEGERGLPGRDAAAAHADLDLDVHVEARPGRGDLPEVFEVVDADAESRALGERGQACDLRRAHDLVAHEDVVHAAFDQRLGFRDLLAAHAHRAGGNLALCDLRAFVGLGVGPHAHPAGDGLRQRIEVALERVELEDQGRRVDLLDALPDERRRPQSHFGYRIMLRLSACAGAGQTRRAPRRPAR